MLTAAAIYYLHTVAKLKHFWIVVLEKASVMALFQNILLKNCRLFIYSELLSSSYLARKEQYQITVAGNKFMRPVRYRVLADLIELKNLF